MSLRNLLLGLALLAAPWAASAQEQTSATSVEAPAEVSTNSAVRDVYHALFFDSGIFDTMTSEFLPEYRRQATSSVYYRRASGERREALDRVIEATPQYMREEIMAETFVMADNVSERAAELLSANDIAMLANFLRDPNWRPFMARMALQGANKGPDSIGADDLSAEEEAQMNDYAETHFSPQLMENGGAFMNLLVGEMRAASPRLQPRIQRRLAVEICAALDDRCPRELRDQIRTL